MSVLNHITLYAIIVEIPFAIYNGWFQPTPSAIIHVISHSANDIMFAGLSSTLQCLKLLLLTIFRLKYESSLHVGPTVHHVLHRIGAIRWDHSMVIVRVR